MFCSEILYCPHLSYSHIFHYSKYYHLLFSISKFYRQITSFENPAQQYLFLLIQIPVLITQSTISSLPSIISSPSEIVSNCIKQLQYTPHYSRMLVLQKRYFSLYFQTTSLIFYFAFLQLSSFRLLLILPEKYHFYSQSFQILSLAFVHVTLSPSYVFVYFPS